MANQRDVPGGGGACSADVTDHQAPPAADGRNDVVERADHFASSRSGKAAGGDLQTGYGRQPRLSRVLNRSGRLGLVLYCDPQRDLARRDVSQSFQNLDVVAIPPARSVIGDAQRSDHMAVRLAYRDSGPRDHARRSKWAPGCYRHVVPDVLDDQSFIRFDDVLVQRLLGKIMPVGDRARADPGAVREPGIIGDGDGRERGVQDHRGNPRDLVECLMPG